MKIKNLLIVIISVALCIPAVAQSPKQAEQTKAKPVAPAKASKQNHGTFLQSHSKQIGGFGPFQVHSLRIRGLDSPNVSAAVIYDPRSETYTVVGPATGAGLGSAILGAAGNVGSAAVFGASLRPTRINETISNDSESEGSSAKSTSEGGTAVSVSEGGDAVSVSDADAKSSSTSAAVAVSSSSVKNHNSVRNSNSNTSINSNVNANSNQQSQGQLQGQQQGQGQVQGQSNHNKAPKAPKKSKKSKK